jgi:hypothetical protein
MVDAIGEIYRTAAAPQRAQAGVTPEPVAASTRPDPPAPGTLQGLELLELCDDAVGSSSDLLGGEFGR